VGGVVGGGVGERERMFRMGEWEIGSEHGTSRCSWVLGVLGGGDSDLVVVVGGGLRRSGVGGGPREGGMVEMGDWGWLGKHGASWCPPVLGDGDAESVVVVVVVGGGLRRTGVGGGPRERRCMMGRW
jgi:hypothetical protein